MKKLIATITAFVLVFSGLVYVQPVKTVEAAGNVWDGTTADTSWYDAENVKDEYTITTAAQLAGLAKLANGEVTGAGWVHFEGKTIKLGADITLNDVSDFGNWNTTPPLNSWTPIGDGKGSGNGHGFRGTFDGNGYTISGMYINGSEDVPLGLFGKVFYNSTAPSIKNVKLINSYINNAAAEKVGMLAGWVYCINSSTTGTISIEDVYVQGTIDNTYANARIGGICGMTNGKNYTDVNMSFKNIVSDVDINSAGCTKQIGGLLGSGQIKKNSANDAITSPDTFENCVNLGNLSDSGSSCTIGGFYGDKAGTARISVVNCVNAGDITAQRVGGIVGNMNATPTENSLNVIQFINVGTITGTGGQKGALWGNRADTDVHVSQSYSVANDNMNSATTMELAALTGSNALTTLAESGFDVTAWNMVAGIAPLPKQVAQMCGFVFKGASLTLDSSLQMNFKVKKDAVTEGVPSSVTFALNGDEKTVTTNIEDGEYYVYSCSEIAPYQISDKVTATLHTTYDGVAIAGAMEYSVSEYCYKVLETYTGTEYSNLQTLIVDLLNYGTESQKRAEAEGSHTVTSYANAALTEPQKEMASTDRTLTSVLDKAYATITSPSATWKAAGLNLTEKVVIRLQFETTENITGWYVKFSDGNQKSVDVTEIIAAATHNRYYVYLDQLNAYQMSDNIYATVYDAEGNAVSDTLQYSVESYAYAQQDVTDGNLGALVKAMMRYGNSAAAYQSN